MDGSYDKSIIISLVDNYFYEIGDDLIIINNKSFPTENHNFPIKVSNGPEDEALDLLYGRGLVRKSTVNFIYHLIVMEHFEMHTEDLFDLVTDMYKEYCYKVAGGDTAYVSDVHHFASARDSFVVAGVETSTDESAYCK